MAAAGVEIIAAELSELAPLAQQSSSCRLATAARSTSLKILCDQLEHTQAKPVQLEQELDKLMESDDAVRGLKSTPEFGRKTVAVLRAEMGDVSRFQRVEQVVAYVGLDLEVK
jgi:transposase